MNYGDLVSIVVVSYNSENFIIETLNSIKNQEYKKLELIISDDCSTDNTVVISNQWIENNKDRFVDCKIIESTYNTGLSCNLERGGEHANGEWIKYIAADDLLLPNCINDYVHFVVSNSNVLWVCSKAFAFTGEYNEHNFVDRYNNRFKGDYYKKFELSAEGEHQLMLKSNFICSPTVFTNRMFYLSNMSILKKYPYCDDYPMFLLLLSKGHKIYYLDVETVGYRMHESSLSHSSKFLFNEKFVNSWILVQQDMCFPFITKEECKKRMAFYKSTQIISRLGWNHRNVFCRIIFKLLRCLYRYI